MPARILDGKDLARRLGERLSRQVEGLKAKGIAPRIASILVAGDEASEWYVKNQGKSATKLGIGFDLEQLPHDTSAEKLAGLIERLNKDASITGIMLQVPLPQGLNGDEFQQLISPAKNIEGMNNRSLGEMLRGGDQLVPCTARAVIEILLDAGIEMSGKRAVVVGKSAIVGKPLALMLLAREATVTVCHRMTQDLASICREADILCTAVGRRAGMFDASYVKAGATVIDIAIIQKSDGGITGDVDAPSVTPIAGALAPVPGGVGPVTTMMLMRNALIAAEAQSAK